MQMLVKQILPTSCLPVYATKGSAGIDLHACHSLMLNPGDTRLVGTGIAIELPPGMVGLVCSRSGLASKHSVFVLNAPGVIDPDYRGEICAILHNAGREKLSIKVGDRIAQLLVMPFAQPYIRVSTELSSTERGDGGFGSTGLL